MNDFDNKVAFVTGGASGIGLGIVKAFLGAGMRVVAADVSDRHLAQLRADFADQPRLHSIKLDVTDRAAMAAAARETVARFGRVHVLVNNAGIGMLGPIAQAGYDDWDWAMGVNLTGVFNGIHEFLPLLLEHGEGGHIVSTASMAAIVPIPNCSIYIAAKCALMGLSESLHGELAPQGICVSVLCPGPVVTNIGQVRDLRPAAYRRDSGYLEMEDRLADRTSSPNWMSIEEAGERVLQGMREKAIFILTHREFKEGAQERCQALVKAFPDEPVNKTRAAEIGMLTSNSIYRR